MKQIKTRSMKRMATLTGAMLVLGTVNVLPERLGAQEPGTPAETPAVRAAPSGRARPVRMVATEDMPGPAPERMTSRSPTPAPRPPAEIAPARFEATVYEIQVPENRIDALEAPALQANAATPQDLAKALGAFGKAKVLYKIDQTVNLYGESIMLNTREPMITGTRTMGSGPAINTITYQEVGLIVNLAASPPPKDSPRKELTVHVNVELSTLADSGVEIAPGVRATSIRNLHLSHSETPRFGKPLVLLNTRSSCSRV